MSKALVRAMSRAYADRFGRMEECVVLGFERLAAADAADLRGRLAAQRARLFVLRNVLARRALEETGRGALGAALEGPSAIVSDAEAVAIVRAVCAWPGHKAGKVRIAGAALGRDVLSAAQAEALASLPDLPTMRSQVLATVLGPATAVLNLVEGTRRQALHLVIGQLRKQEEGSGAASAA